jgi:membrane-associated PAP2 superfamily phosphatase
MHPTTQSNDTPLSSSRATERRRFWFWHAIVPLALFVALTLMFHWLPIDVTFARDWAYDTVHGRWLGRGHWWAEGLIHTDGRIAILLVIAGLLVTLVLSLKVARLRTWRSTTAYLLAAILLGWGLVGGLKEVTNVPCPWSLQGFGGERPHVGLFDARPPDFGPAKCFPGAHSGSGFALFAFYFAFRDRRPRRALLALAIAAATGAVFAFGQEARGAHFLSHDLTSMFLVWFVSLGTYHVWRQRFVLARARTARLEFRPASAPRGSAPLPLQPGPLE